MTSEQLTVAAAGQKYFDPRERPWDDARDG
jgi:hypothetical protein